MLFYLLPEKPFDKQRPEYINEAHTYAYSTPLAHMAMFNDLFSFATVGEAPKDIQSDDQSGSSCCHEGVFTSLSNI